MGTQSYYIPKQMFSPEYKGISAEAKILFAMVFTNASSVKSIRETANLISSLDDSVLTEFQIQKNSIPAENEV